MDKLTLKLLLIFTLIFSCHSSFAQSEVDEKQRAREFIMSCTYGVLTGTLIGAASLAFTDQPGEYLHRIARGASLGLYAGIALGVYVLYYVPKQAEGEEYIENEVAPPGEGLSTQWMINPVFTEDLKIDGLEFNMQLMNW